MNLVYYTSAISGTGRLIRGISIGNALVRNNIDCEYTILSSSKFTHFCDILNIKHMEIPIESETSLLNSSYEDSFLYKAIVDLEPDILIIDMLWFTLYSFIDKLKCYKIFLCNFVFDDFFSIRLPDGTLEIDPEQYNLLLAVEPFSCSVPMNQINPIVLRNRNEIMPRGVAAEKLGLDPLSKNCLYAFSHNPEDYDKYKKKYSYLDDFYHMFYTSTYEGGIFPILDYFNAFDFIVAGAGYNIFWEVNFFEKEAVFENVDLKFSSTQKRMELGYNYKFKKNGGDQLVDIISKL